MREYLILVGVCFLIGWHIGESKPTCDCQVSTPIGLVASPF